MIAIGADHGGFEIKEAIKKYLNENKKEYIDFGTFSNDSVSYVPIALKVAKEVASKQCDKAILCCGTGIGISIAANKVKGIRAAVCENEFCAEMCRRHNNANILCLGGRVISPAKAVELTKIFLDTPFDGGRHADRLNQINELENSNN